MHMARRPSSCRFALLKNLFSILEKCCVCFYFIACVGTERSMTVRLHCMDATVTTQLRGQASEKLHVLQRTISVTETAAIRAHTRLSVSQSGVRCQLSVVRCPLSGVRCQVSVVRCPLSGVQSQHERSYCPHICSSTVLPPGKSSTTKSFSPPPVGAKACSAPKKETGASRSPHTERADHGTEPASTSELTSTATQHHTTQGGERRGEERSNTQRGER